MYVFILFYFIFYVQLREIDIFKESLINLIQIDRKSNW